MKIIDQTPFYDEKGEISFVDRTKAMMQYGAGWIREMEAQKAVISVLEKNLDKKYTLLRNITPPGMNASIPLILVGSTGVYVMCVASVKGMFSARGDQWGTVDSGSFVPQKPNLLTRSERMAKAIQVYLQRQGYADLNSVEAILLCADPATNVDSVRPIIRVVMRDALERFAVSISQARLVLNPESCFDIVNRLLTPPAPTPTKLVETAAATAATQAAEQAKDPSMPAFAMAGTEPGSVSMPEPTEPGWLNAPGESTPSGMPAEPPTEPLSGPSDEIPQPTPPARRPLGITRKQWMFIIIMAVVWIIIILVFGFLIARDFLM